MTDKQDIIIDKLNRIEATVAHMRQAAKPSEPITESQAVFAIDGVLATLDKLQDQLLEQADHLRVIARAIRGK